MKNALTIFMIVLFSHFADAQNTYLQLWKEVAKFEQQGLEKSAFEKASEIYAKAKKEQNNPQIIKALLHTSKYQLTLEEDAELTIINTIKTEIATQSFPSKNILQSILGQLYWQYYQSNRYKFYSRSKTAEKVDAADFRTWDLDTLFAEISTQLDASLSNPEQLQRLELSTFDEILRLQKGSKTFRPTVYDFLAHNALEFYKSSENSITKPEETFEIDNEVYLGNAKSFSEIQITSTDSLSQELKALKLYQDLLRFHLNDSSPEALIAVNIERLEFVQQKATFDDSKEKLIEALQNAQKIHATHPYAAMYTFKIASLYREFGSRYNSEKNDKTHQWEYQKAVALCNSVITKFPETEAAKKCANLKREILKKEFTITTENVVPIENYSRVSVKYRNVDKLYFSVRAITYDKLGEFYKLSSNKRTQFINSLPKSKSWNAILPSEKDHQFHTTEIAVPPLQNGIYMLTVSGTENYTSDLSGISIIQATNIAITHKKMPDEYMVQVTDRTDGTPVKNQEINISYRFNYGGTKQKETRTTDATGTAKLFKRRNRNFQDIDIVVVTANDTAYFDNFNYYNSLRNTEVDTQEKLFLFTDRSIYRPSQTLYFKGILVRKKGTTSTVLRNEKVKLTLRDANYQVISENSFTTNDYGSIQGEFVIPNNGLTGEFSLSASKNDNGLGSEYFYVEEYKRPKFAAEFSPVTETFAVNDTVTIKGNAKAFAGSAISEAKVSYSVMRTPRYPQWVFWRRPYISTASQQITSGETTTDASGNFEIDFTAIPNASVQKELLPIFDYKVTADITDINGETRNATTVVHVGYHSLQAKVQISNRLDAAKKDHKIEIDTRNLNNEKVPAKGMITIHKLQAPDRVLRKRPFKVPDYQSISETEFKKLFPNEAYSKEEQDYRSWKKGEKVFETNFDTEQSSKLDIGKIKRWESGKYIVEITSTDSNGFEIKDYAYTDVFNTKDTTAADNQLLEVTTDKSSYVPTEEVVLTINSGTDIIKVTVDIEKDERIVQSYVLSLKDGKQTIRIPVSKDDEGGFMIHCMATIFNSFIKKRIPVVVKYPPTELTIETGTFRDKLKPAQEETWSFKIKGPKGEKVAAELLASMYDASLDEFKSHNWGFNPLSRPVYYGRISITAGNSFDISRFGDSLYDQEYNSYNSQLYDSLDWFGLYLYNNRRLRSFRNKAALESASMAKRAAPAPSSPELEYEYKATLNASGDESDGFDLLEKDENSRDGDASSAKEYELFTEETATVVPRKNLQETAFFFPQLQTDSEGNVSFTFTTPEALTKWNLQLLAHTKELHTATKTLTTVTQKELMVLPNAPRFFREGDKVVVSSKISNLSEKNLSGEASLQLVDPISGADINPALFPRLGTPTQAFSVDAQGNTQVSWTLYIPKGLQAAQYTITARAGEFSDGEQNALPVLSNRMLVTETLPMWIRSNQTKTFTLDKLAESTSTTLTHHKLSLEMTSNPAWYAVQALPYLMEYPYDCSEQTFSRYYANTLASHIANSNPRIQQVFNQWKSSDALLSNLEKNQELKSLILQETPWVRDAQSETEQKKRIALLFDLNRMKNEQQKALKKLQQMQLSSGGFPWFSGGRENRFITQHIITGFGHLKQLNVLSEEDENTQQLIQKAVQYLDNAFIKEYKDIRKYNKEVDLTKDHLSFSQLHYLYMRSFFGEIPLSKEAQTIRDYYLGQIDQYWLSRSLYAKGVMALVSHRMQRAKTATGILRSLEETSITSEELGMYWKANTPSWFWYQAPIETQALLIEAFSEISNDVTTVDNLKIWLLKHKQTNRWATTKATADAVYALLLQGSDWISVTDMVDVTVGSEQISPKTLENVKVEAGTGYFKTAWNGNEVTQEMAKVTLTKKGNGIAWGGLYWQYFEDLDKITTAETSLQLKKKLFKRTYDSTGEVLTEINENTKLELGDLVRVRIELRNDRPIEFVHMKDMRAAGFEPINVLSQYKWQDGLGYYESTKDASTNFFFDYLPKGVFVFEYDLRVNNKGDFSNGISTIQSMYAPEFSSHSEGVRVKVE